MCGSSSMAEQAAHNRLVRGSSPLARTNRYGRWVEMKEIVDTGGIDFVDALAIAFIVLKLCDVIDWGWMWVLAPIWIPAIIGLLILFCKIIYHAIQEWRQYD